MIRYERKGYVYDCDDPAADLFFFLLFFSNAGLCSQPNLWSMITKKGRERRSGEEDEGGGCLVFGISVGVFTPDMQEKVKSLPSIFLLGPFSQQKLYTTHAGRKMEKENLTCFFLTCGRCGVMVGKWEIVCRLSAHDDLSSGYYKSTSDEGRVNRVLEQG